jgi:cytochrome c553
VQGAIPSIAGRPEAEFIELLRAYREGANAVMVSVARSLDEEQMAALAAYFGSLPQAPSGAGPPR